MKKFSILSLLVIFTMLLAACGGSGTTDLTPGVGTDVVGGAGTSVVGSGTNVGTEVGGIGTSVSGGLDMTGTPTVGTGIDMTGTPTTSVGGVGSGTSTPAIPVTGDMTAQDCVKVSNLIGLNVVNQQGDDLGKVNDAIVDVRTSQIQYIVLGSGGLLGIGEKNIPIPWNMVDSTDFTCNTSAGSVNGTGSGSADFGATATVASGVSDGSDMGTGTGTPTVSTGTSGTGSMDANGVNFVDHLVVMVQKDSFDTAPTIDLNNTDFSVSMWDQEFNSFWMNAQSGAGSSSGTGSNSGLATGTPTVSGSNSGSSSVVATSTPTTSGSTSGSSTDNSGSSQSTDNSMGVVNMVLLSKLMDADVYSNSGVGTGLDNSGVGNGTSGSGTGVDMTATPAAGTTNNSGGSSTDNSSNSGEKIGSIKEIIYNGQTGMIQYVVIDPDDVVVSDDVMIPVPLSALTIQGADSGSNDLRIMVNQNQLSSAPNFATDSFPYGVQGWDTDLNGFWSTGSGSSNNSSSGG